MERNAELKSLLNNRFVKKLREGGGLPRLALLLFLGVLLIFLGARSGSLIRSADSVTESVSEEEALQKICESVTGVGDCRVIIGYTPAARASERRVESVCVVCRGASSAKVRERLTELITSLYGIGSNRIYIAPLG